MLFADNSVLIQATTSVVNHKDAEINRILLDKPYFRLLQQSAVFTIKQGLVFTRLN